MSLTCPACDLFTLAGSPTTSNLSCTSCNAQIPANILLLFLITGASGTGKSTLVRHLRTLLPDCLVVGGDLLIDMTNRDRDAFLKRWLRVAYATAQSEHPLVLAGGIQKNELEGCVDRGLVGQIYTVVLRVDEKTRRERLEERPRWGRMTEQRRRERIAEHVGFEERVIKEADLAVDTGERSVEEVAREVAAWIMERVVTAGPSMAPAV